MNKNFIKGFEKNAFIAAAAKLLGNTALNAGKAVFGAGKTVVRNPGKSLTAAFVGSDVLSGAKAGEQAASKLNNFY